MNFNINKHWFVTSKFNIFFYFWDHNSYLISPSNAPINPFLISFKFVSSSFSNCCYIHICIWIYIYSKYNSFISKYNLICLYAKMQFLQDLLPSTENTKSPCWNSISSVLWKTIWEFTPQQIVQGTDIVHQLLAGEQPWVSGTRFTGRCVRCYVSE